MRRRIRGIRNPVSVWIYVSTEFILSFIVSFLFFFVVFLINQVIYMAEQMLSKHAAPLDVARLLFFAMPSFVALSFPFASLVGALMSIGRLNSDNEILVMEASGVSLKRVFAPFLALGILFSGISFAVNDYLLPLGNLNFLKLYRKLVYSTPALELKSFSINQYQSSTIVTGRVEGRVIGDIMIFDTTESRKQRTITASSATLAENAAEQGVISLELQDVFVIETDPERKDRFEYSRSERMVYNILLKDLIESVSSLGPRDMTSIDLKRAIDEKNIAFKSRQAELLIKKAREADGLAILYGERSSQAGLELGPAWDSLRESEASYSRVMKEEVVDKGLLNFEREFHKKFALPFGAVCFVLFAFPIGLMARRSGRMVGIGVGLIVAVLYWIMNYWGDMYGYSLRLPPAVLMWFPNALIVAAGAAVAIARRLS
jgi:lipopolysaccharide export system permease protein